MESWYIPNFGSNAVQGLELIFYGDSITEQWRGTDQGG